MVQDQQITIYFYILEWTGDHWAVVGAPRFDTEQEARDFIKTHPLAAFRIVKRTIAVYDDVLPHE